MFVYVIIFVKFLFYIIYIISPFRVCHYDPDAYIFLCKARTHRRDGRFGERSALELTEILFVTLKTILSHTADEE